ncbi:hypothetical protein F4678DRAFT_456666 [Xylaria arbuscula]|nr:hypothetical protein F4678DRAFT_456666 [Xylaria arbuscula]
MQAHDQAVPAVLKRLQEFHARREAFGVYHSSTNSTRAIQKDGNAIVDTSRLSHERPSTMGWFRSSSSSFRDITVGGGFSGSVGESSPGRHGPFDGTVNWIEIVRANGEVRRASKTEDSDLF